MIKSVQEYTLVKPPKMPRKDLQMAANEGFELVCEDYDRELMNIGSFITDHYFCGFTENNLRNLAVQGAYASMVGAYLNALFYTKKSGNDSGLNNWLETRMKKFQAAADRHSKLYGCPDYTLFIEKKTGEYDAVYPRAGFFRTEDRIYHHLSHLWDDETPLREFSHYDRGNSCSESQRVQEIISLHSIERKNLHQLDLDPKISNPAEEHPVILYGSGKYKYRQEMYMLSERFSK